MENTTKKPGQTLTVLALVFGASLFPLVCGVTGCHTGDRYTQSTGEYLDDHTLSSRVKKSLGDDQEYKYANVNVETFKGVVQLSGFVNTPAQKGRAGDLAQKTEGVREVKNNISIKE